MSFYAISHRRAAPDWKDRFEYLAIYSICFALSLVPVTIRRLFRLGTEKPGQDSSIFGETRRLAANCAATSFAGL